VILVRWKDEADETRRDERLIAEGKDGMVVEGGEYTVVRQHHPRAKERCSASKEMEDRNWMASRQRTEWKRDDKWRGDKKRNGRETIDVELKEKKIEAVDLFDILTLLAILLFFWNFRCGMKRQKDDS
jgi:hypothetical protein